MRRIATTTAALAGAAALLPATAAAGHTSHTDVWQNKDSSAICGIEARALSRKEVLCGASGIPRPAHSSPNVGDPDVEIAATGKPKLVLISQDSYVASAKIKTLAAGTVWSARGVTCTVGARKVTCQNRSGHGFTIGNHHYKSF